MSCDVSDCESERRLPCSLSARHVLTDDKKKEKEAIMTGEHLEWRGATCKGKNRATWPVL